MEIAMICRGSCNKEPVLSDLLDDPIVRLLMARDGVSRVDVETLMDEVPICPKEDKSQIAVCACRRS